MAKGFLTVRGLPKLSQKMKTAKDLRAVKAIVKSNGAEMQQAAIDNTEKFTGHWKGKTFVKPTGETKLSISKNSGLKDRGMSYHVKPGTEYASYPEYGTRFMTARPYIRPAIKGQKAKFRKDLERLFR